MTGRPALRVSAASLARATLQASGVTVLAALVATEITAVYADRAHAHPYATDFDATIWQPARNVLHGLSPYADPHAAGFVPASVYPPSAFLPALPLAWLDLGTATVCFQVAVALAGVGALLALGVRDPRCHLLWLLTPLMLIPILSANLTPLVVLCAALLWRWRTRPALAAAALSAAIALKLFLAPLWLWLLLTRRYRAAAYTPVATAAAVVGCWALIRFDGFAAYPALLKADAASFGADGAFVQALVRQLGLGPAPALAVAGALALALLAVARRSSELVAFALVSAAAVALSPIGWVFYAGVLIVPLAVRHARFARPWLVLGAFWVSWYHSPLPYTSVELSVATIAATAWLLAAACRRPAPARVAGDAGRSPRPA